MQNDKTMMDALAGEGSLDNVKQWHNPTAPKVPSSLTEVNAQDMDSYKKQKIETLQTTSADANASEANAEEDWLVLDDLEESSAH